MYCTHDTGLLNEGCVVIVVPKARTPKPELVFVFSVLTRQYGKDGALYSPNGG